MNEDLLNAGVAIAGWVVAVVTLIFGYVERKASREEDRLSKTLDYFEGGSQRRSIGISLIEGVWLKKARFHSILVPLVANQIVYLLLSSESHDAHNERNLVRLVAIFSAVPRLQQHYHARWADVCDALLRKYEGETKGIPVARTTLGAWAKNLGYQLHA